MWDRDHRGREIGDTDESEGTARWDRSRDDAHPFAKQIDQVDVPIAP